jgi:hypothetical protein
MNLGKLFMPQIFHLSGRNVDTFLPRVLGGVNEKIIIVHLTGCLAHNKDTVIATYQYSYQLPVTN